MSCFLCCDMDLNPRKTKIMMHLSPDPLCTKQTDLSFPITKVTSLSHSQPVKALLWCTLGER